MIVVLLGPPGSGKGTQGERIAAKLAIPKIATGDVLRDAVKAGSRLGLQAQSYMDRGDLVPDSVILGIMKEALAQPAQAKGVILDGVVRTVPQAEGLAKVAQQLDRHVDAVLAFDIADEEIISRLSSRTTCDTCQTPFTGLAPGSPCPRNDVGKLVRRKDDEPAAIKNRLKVYREQTAPVLSWYETQGLSVAHIDALGTMDAVTTRAMAALGR